MIRPALEAGRDVVSDRFSDSSVAYQGAARGLGVGEVIALCDTATDGLWPDLTLLLKVDPEVGLGRAEGEDRFEAEGLELQRAVADAYEEIAMIAADRVVVDRRRPARSRRSTRGSSPREVEAWTVDRRMRPATGCRCERGDEAASTRGGRGSR